MTLEEQVDRDLVTALKARDATTLATLRLLKAAAKNAEVERRRPLTDDEYQDVIVRQAKLRREAATEFERGGRQDRADQERAELGVLERYLPQQMDDSALIEILERVIADTGATGPGDLGKVMSQVMPAVKGRALGARVNQLARELLARQAT